MSTALSGRKLDWLLRARGTNLGVWPAAERVAALDLLRRSPEAQLLYAEALARDDAREDEAPDTDGAVFGRMQDALRRRLAPLSLAWRGVGVGVLLACVAAGLYLAVDATDPDAASDLFSTAQTVTFAALDQ